MHNILNTNINYQNCYKRQQLVFMFLWRDIGRCKGQNCFALAHLRAQSDSSKITCIIRITKLYLSICLSQTICDAVLFNGKNGGSWLPFGCPKRKKIYFHNRSHKLSSVQISCNFSSSFVTCTMCRERLKTIKK